MNGFPWREMEDDRFLVFFSSCVCVCMRVCVCVCVLSSESGGFKGVYKRNKDDESMCASVYIYICIEIYEERNFV